MTPSPLDPFPPSASTFSRSVDLVSVAVIGVVGLVTLGVVVAMIVFAVRYRRRPGNTVGRGHEHAVIRRMEIAWSAGTFAVFIGFFLIGARVFGDLLDPPADPDAVDVFVTGKRWMWKFQQPTGRREIGRLHVPAGRVVRLHLHSEDVIHSFYVPAFRLKLDVVPGWTRTTWFEATEPGVYALACAEYCGTNHWDMRGEIEVMEPHRYDAWLQRQEGDPPTLEAAGRVLFERYDCVTCHETRRRRGAPPLVGLYGRTVVLADGSTTVADDDYIRRSIREPAAQVVAGYHADEMPAYDGLIPEEELFLLVAYVRSLGRAGVHR